MTACTLPPPLDEATLLESLDGEVDPHVADHLARCPSCRSRAAALAARERPLRAALFRVDCPSPDQWRDFYFGWLPADEATPLARHLDQCPYCTRELLILRAFVPPSELAPAPTPTPASNETLWERVQWWVARLLQGPPVPLAAGLRGARGDGQWIYHAGDVQVGVHSQPDPTQPNRCVLVGALMCAQPLGWTAHLWDRGRLVATATIDDLGGFSFAGLPCGDYELTLAGPETRIYVPELTLN